MAVGTRESLPYAPRFVRCGPLCRVMGDHEAIDDAGKRGLTSHGNDSGLHLTRARSPAADERTAVGAGSPRPFDSRAHALRRRRPRANSSVSPRHRSIHESRRSNTTTGRPPIPVPHCRCGRGVRPTRAGHEVADLTDAMPRSPPGRTSRRRELLGRPVGGRGQRHSVGVLLAVHPAPALGRVPTVRPRSQTAAGVLGRVRDAAVRTARDRPLEHVMLPPINEVRAMSTWRRWHRWTSFCAGRSSSWSPPESRSSIRTTEWGDSVQMIGPCVLDPGPDETPDWMAAIDQPIVLVTTSSEKQADDETAAHRAGRAGRRAGARGRHRARRATRRHRGAAQRDGAPVRPTRRGAGPRRVRGDARRHGRDAEGTRPWHPGLRGAVRTRPARGRTPRRGGAVRHPAACQEAVASRGCGPRCGRR